MIDSESSPDRSEPAAAKIERLCSQGRSHLRDLRSTTERLHMLTVLFEHFVTSTRCLHMLVESQITVCLVQFADPSQLLRLWLVVLQRQLCATLFIK